MNVIICSAYQTTMIDAQCKKLYAELAFFPFLSYSFTSVANQAVKLITIFSFDMPYLGRQGRGSSLKICLSL